MSSAATKSYTINGQPQSLKRGQWVLTNERKWVKIVTLLPYGLRGVDEAGRHVGLNLEEVETLLRVRGVRGERSLA